MNRSRWLQVLLLASATGMRLAGASEEPSAAQLLRQTSEEFSSNFIRFIIQAERVNPPLPVDDYWRALDQLNVARTNGAEPVRIGLHFGYAAQLISRVGTLEDFGRLLAFADTLPAESWERRHVMNALLDFAIRLEVDGLARQTPLNVRVPVDDPRIESKVEGVSAEVAAANRLFNAVCSLRPTPPVPDGKMSVQENWGSFYDTISALLHGKLPEATRAIQQFRWGGWCGTGREMLAGPQSRALFLACLQDRKFETALGAVCAITGSHILTLPILQDDGAARRKFVTWCGLDWETLFAGALVDRRWYGEGDWTRSLARFGTERSARLLAGMAGMPPAANESAFLWAVGAFAGESQSLMDTNADGTIRLRGFWGNKPYAHAGPNPAPPDLQLTLLEILHARLQATNVNRTTAEVVVSILAELRRPESKSVLEEAMRLPYEHVRQTAAGALERMGERVQRPPATAPAVFRIRVNGEPLVGTPVDYEVRLARGGVSSRPTTTAQGELTIARDWLVDPNRRPTSIVFAAVRMKSVTGPCFQVETGMPIDFEKPTAVEVRLQTVTLNLETRFPVERVAGETMRLWLKAKRDKSYGRYLDAVSDEMLLPFSRALTFSALQPGEYELDIRLSGAALASIPFEVGANKADLVPVFLDPGADVRYELIAPGGASPVRRPTVEIVRADRRLETYRYVDGRTNLLRGLPVGEYSLRVPSRADQLRRTFGANELIPAGSAYQGTNVRFSIMADSPRLIDLGSLNLKAE